MLTHTWKKHNAMPTRTDRLIITGTTSSLYPEIFRTAIVCNRDPVTSSALDERFYSSFFFLGPGPHGGCPRGSKLGSASRIGAVTGSEVARLVRDHRLFARRTPAIRRLSTAEVVVRASSF